MKLSSETILARAGFVPRKAETSAACASCPFRAGNGSAWRRFWAKLNQSGWLHMFGATDEQVAAVDPESGRKKIRDAVAHPNGGNFPCHGTQYTPDMGMRPPGEWKQCAGATRYFKTGQSVAKGAAR